MKMSMYRLHVCSTMTKDDKDEFNKRMCSFHILIDVIELFHNQRGLGGLGHYHVVEN